MFSTSFIVKKLCFEAAIEVVMPLYSFGFAACPVYYLLSFIILVIESLLGLILRIF